MSTPRIKLLLVDDHAILRSGLKRLLGEMAEVSEIGEAANAAEMLDRVRDAHWDVIVLDLDTSVRGIEVHGGDPVLTAELILDRVEALGAVRVVQLDEGSHR